MKLIYSVGVLALVAGACDKKNEAAPPQAPTVAAPATPPPAVPVPAPTAQAAAPAAPAAGEAMAMGAKKDDAAAKNLPASFAKMPPLGTKAVCPVSKEVFTVTAKTESATYQGQTYVFCCPDCKPDFEKAPAKYTQAKN